MVNFDQLVVYSWLVPVLPLIGALLIGALRRRLGAVAAGGTATVLVLLGFVISALLLCAHDPAQRPVTIVNLWEWLQVGEMRIALAFQIDALSLTMMTIVTGIGTLIHLYSIGYMHDDKRVASFFALLNLFTFAMLLLVMGSNFLVSFIGWEGVGLCSYLLIGFWYSNPEYNYAARKAFVMNRIGDVGVVLALCTLFQLFGTLDYLPIMERAASLGTGNPMITAAALLLFVGAMGKSAQLPLFTWLPDAMAGPTPVSALIHAATMVTAGIFLVVRSSVLFSLAPIAQEVVLWVGVGTALLAASIGLFQNDIKKVLAYSTVSQLGYMFAALGVGAYSAGMFHVTTHAFFKALLFLGAGSVIHALSGEQDIRKMGGLKGVTKVTHATFLIGTLAIAGIFPFSGFFSKDSILAHAYQHSPLVYGLLLVGAAMTAFYMFRLYFLTFWGSYRGKAHPHESPATITVPLVILAVLSAGGGLLNPPHVFGGGEQMKNYLATAAAGIGQEHMHLSVPLEWTLMGLSTVLVLVMAFWAYQRYAKRTTLDGDPAQLSGIAKLVAEKWRIDELYAALFERPFGALSRALYRTVEQQLVVPVMNGVGALAQRSGTLLRRVQTGHAGTYLFAMVAGVLALLWITLLRA